MMATLVKSRCRTDSGYRAAARDWLLSAWSGRCASCAERLFLADRCHSTHCRYFLGMGCVRQSNGPSDPLPRIRFWKNWRFELAWRRPCTVAASISQ